MADAYLGEIRAFGGNYAPEGWALCDGTILPISGNEALYSLLGNVYGGSSPNNFALPDLRGKVPISQGQGASLTARTVGQTGGSETVTLTTSQLPAHNHTFTVSTVTNPASVTTPTSSTFLGSLSSPTGTVIGYISSTVSNVTPEPLNNAAVSISAGGSQPHENRMNYVAITYIICLAGLYPQSS